MTTMEPVLAVLAIIGALGGVVLGHYLASTSKETERRRRLSSVWAALEAEIISCGKLARTFLRLLEDDDE